MVKKRRTVNHYPLTVQHLTITLEPMQTHINYRRHKDIIHLTFTADEEGQPPTLDSDVLDRLADLLDRIAEERDHVRVVLIRSNNEKYFCRGSTGEALAELDAQRVVGWVRRGHEVFNQLAEFPLPVIAWVEGFALGGGLELALACDLILATDSAKLGQSENLVGLGLQLGGELPSPAGRRAGRKPKRCFSPAYSLLRPQRL